MLLVMFILLLYLALQIMIVIQLNILSTKLEDLERKLENANRRDIR